MRIVTVGNRHAALGLTWFGRVPTHSARRQARGLARRLGWDVSEMAFAERTGPIAQLGVTSEGARLPRNVRAVAPACASESQGDLLVLLRLDEETGWILAVRRGSILVHGDRIVPWAERAPAIEELQGHLEEPQTLIEEDADRARNRLEKLVCTTGPRLETVWRRPWKLQWRRLALLLVLPAGILLGHDLESQGRSVPQTVPSGQAERLAFLRLWREDRSPGAWRRDCLTPLLALPLVRRGRELKTLRCTPQRLIAHYTAPLSLSAALLRPSPTTDSDPGLVIVNVPLDPRKPVPALALLNSPAITDARVTRLLAILGLEAAPTGWKRCLSPSRTRSSELNRLRCRRLRVTLAHEPAARLRLLLHAFASDPGVRVQRLIARLSPPTWTLEGTLYAESTP